MYDIVSQAISAKNASNNLSKLTEEQINKTLTLSAKLLRENKDYLIKENSVDVQNAREKGLTDAFIDRLTLTEKVIESMAVGIEQVASLPCPLGKVVYSYENQEQGITIEKKTVPFGVVGIIYESRPNVTADAFALCFKTANAVILKGGSDSLRSNIAVVKDLPS